MVLIVARYYYHYRIIAVGILIIIIAVAARRSAVVAYAPFFTSRWTALEARGAVGAEPLQSEGHVILGRSARSDWSRDVFAARGLAWIGS